MKVLITLEGGLVQGVLADAPDVEVIIVDYDTEGADNDEITDIPQDGGDTAEACARIELAQVDPNFINNAYKALTQ